MQAKVPKFIDIEDKVVGPLTWRQFAFVGGGAAFAMLFIWRFKSLLGVPLAALAFGFGVAFAFHKVNGRPFSIFLTSFWRYQVNPRRFFWEKDKMAKMRQPQVAATIDHEARSAASQVDGDKLSQIAAALDVKKKIRHQDYSE